MSLHTREQFVPLSVPAASTVAIASSAIGGFFANTAGVVTINGTTDQGSPFVVVVFTAAANTWYSLPFYIGANGGTIVTDATASGVLAR